MALQGGPYDHPSYLTHQLLNWGATTAGASGTSLVLNFPLAVRLRNVTATVVTAGTSATTGNKVDIFVGTSSVGTITLGTSAALTTGTSGDLNTTVGVGTQIFLKNGTDATGVARVTAEYHLDPSATWNAP